MMIIQRGLEAAAVVAAARAGRLHQRAADALASHEAAAAALQKELAAMADEDTRHMAVNAAA